MRLTKSIVALALGSAMLAGCNSTGSAPGPEEVSASVSAAPRAELVAAAIVNAQRKRMGLAELEYAPQVSGIARLFASEVSNQTSLSHQSASGAGPGDRLAAGGVQACTFAENIARGQTSPEDVVQSWMASPPHRANILNPRATQYGLGYDPEGQAWVLLLVKPC